MTRATDARGVRFRVSVFGFIKTVGEDEELDVRRSLGGLLPPKLKPEPLVLKLETQLRSEGNPLRN